MKFGSSTASTSPFRPTSRSRLSARDFASVKDALWWIAATPSFRTFLPPITTSATSNTRWGSSRCLLRRKIPKRPGTREDRRVVRSSPTGFRIVARYGVSKASWAGAALRIPVVAPCDREVLRDVDLVEEVCPIRGRPHVKEVPVRAGVVPHPPEGLDGFQGRNAEAEAFVRPREVHRVVPRREVRRLEDPVRHDRPNRLNPTAP